jgi:hypothetical protein
VYGLKPVHIKLTNYHLKIHSIADARPEYNRGQMQVAPQRRDGISVTDRVCETAEATRKAVGMRQGAFVQGFQDCIRKAKS